MRTPAVILREAIEASKLASQNFNNYDLYCVLMHRASSLKLEHAKTQGAAAAKIIMEKYGSWINNDQIASKAMEMAISEKFGIGVSAQISEIGVSFEIEETHSANTLLRAFRNYKPLMKARGHRYFTMFIERENMSELKKLIAA